jgi:hypothetical protein
MKHAAFLAAVTLALSACDPSEKPTTAPAPKASSPLLPVVPGDSWTYQTRVEIPADITSPGAAAVDVSHRRTRTYLGKTSPAEGLPAVDTFEVLVPGSPAEREFVEIHDDRILLRGSIILRPETTRPLWFDQAVPFISADMQPGAESPEIQADGGSLIRKIRVVARENVSVPAGTFPSIEVLMTGTEGNLELHRSIWFAPGVGIVREEKARYQLGQLIFREIQELVEPSLESLRDR